MLLNQMLLKLHSSAYSAVIILALLSILARVVLLDAPELLGEEAYYWNYAIHLAPGYLDHPPMTAWLIAFGTKIFGLTEFGVRAGTLLCCVVTTFFVARLSSLLCGPAIVPMALSVLFLLPYSMGNFFFISPDAPLASAWAASIYFVVRICNLDPSKDNGWLLWSGLGCAFGLGLLSKYTIVLLAVSAAIVFLLQPNLRRWLVRPQPYVAIIIAIVFFSPVIYWNATHEWASIAFQGSRRFSQMPRFSFFDFLGHFILLGTPLGCIVAIYFSSAKLRLHNLQLSTGVKQFLALSFALPVAVFAIYSLRHIPRLNWTGPSFLGLVPILALHIQGVATLPLRYDQLLRRSWIWLFAVSCIGFVGFWSYTGVGIPFAGYSKRMNRLIGWEDLGRKINELALEEGERTTIPAFVIGMDKHYTAAEMAFYVRKAAQSQGIESPEVTGRALIGISSLMFQFWIPSQDLTGRSAILVTRNRTDLEFFEVTKAFEELSPIEVYRAQRNGKPAGQYFYRIGYRFRGAGMVNSIREPTKEGR